MKELLTNTTFVSYFIKVIITIIFAVVSFFVTKLVVVISKKLNYTVDKSKIQSTEDFIKSVVYSCVTYTNQTFVEDLKKENKFTDEKQQEAFQRTYEAVYSIVKNIISNVTSSTSEDSIKTYLTVLIEEAVHALSNSVDSTVSAINTNTLFDYLGDLDSSYDIDNTTVEEFTFDTSAIEDNDNN
jgi:hypothetical protein